MTSRVRWSRKGLVCALGLSSCATGSGGVFGEDPASDASAPTMGAPTDAASGESDAATSADSTPDGAVDEGATALDSNVAEGDDDGAPVDDAPPVPIDATPAGPSGLVYFFPFDGDGADLSGYAHDGALVAVSFVADRAGTAAHAAGFDGVASAMSASGVLLPIGSSPRTITAWVRPDTAPPAGLYANAFVSWGTGNCIGQMFGAGDISNAVNVWTGCDDVLSKGALPKGAWVFVAIRFTPPGTVRVWTGSDTNDVSLPLPPATAASLLWVGAETVDNTSASIRRHFAGAIDSLRIYDRALDDAEVATIATLP